MIGAIIGDVIGSRFEFSEQYKSKEFELITDKCKFTDDTVLSCAIAHSIIYDVNPIKSLKDWALLYSYIGFGPMFRRWVKSDSTEPYNSCGNGSAMRTSPVGWLYNDLDTVLKKAEYYAAITHNHEEGIKGAKAVSAAIFMARTGYAKEQIKMFIEDSFNYDLTTTIDEIRPNYKFDPTCQGSVPQAIRAFLESVDFVDCMRLIISIGGDTDTTACIAGSIADAYYKSIPTELNLQVRNLLTPEIIAILNEFEKKI